MDRFCPICKLKLTEENLTIYYDYTCHRYIPNFQNHHYSERVKDDRVTRMKFRLTDDEFKVYLHVNFDDKYSEVWTQPNDVRNRIHLDTIITPDFTDLQSLKTKLRTYLLFS